MFQYMIKLNKYKNKGVAYMKRFLIILIILITCGCSSQSDNKLDIKKIMEENEYVIIDVRTREEYDEEHLVDAINIPYDEINEDIEISKDTIIFVYCRSGNRSNVAYNTLINLGYTVYDLGAITNIDLPKE